MGTSKIGTLLGGLNVTEQKITITKENIIQAVMDKRISNLDAAELINQWLQDKNFDPNALLQPSNETLLYQAASNNLLGITQALLNNEKTNPNAKNGNGDSPIDIAAQNNHARIVQYLASEIANAPDYKKTPTMGKSHFKKNIDNYIKQIKTDPSFENIKVNLLQYLEDAIKYQIDKGGKEHDHHRNRLIASLALYKKDIRNINDYKGLSDYLHSGPIAELRQSAHSKHFVNKKLCDMASAARTAITAGMQKLHAPASKKPLSPRR